jgi:hypothetical protein
MHHCSNTSYILVAEASPLKSQNPMGKKTFVTVSHTVTELDAADAAGFTHEWTVSVSPGDFVPLLAHVVYDLHETFTHPRRGRFSFFSFSFF